MRREVFAWRWRGVARDRETEARELMLLAVALAASWWDIPSKVGERSFDEIVRKERWASPGNLPD